MNLLRKTLDGLKGLLSGMGLTFGYFVRPSTVITQQYPENRDTLKLPPRTKSRIELLKDTGTDNYLCTACGVCVRACPNNSIQIERTRDPETKKQKLVKYVYHFERCSMCGLCVDSCDHAALGVGSQFENAVYDSSQLTMILNQDRLPPEAAPGTPGVELLPKPPAPKPPAAPKSDA